MNISTLGQRTHFLLRELSALFILCNIKISLPYPLNGFLFYFLLRNNKKAVQLLRLVYVHW